MASNYSACEEAGTVTSIWQRNSKVGPSSPRHESVRVADRTGAIRNSKLMSGAAIMLALWALFLLSALVISWALDLNTRLSISGEGNRMLEAEAAACSGAEIALHPLVNPGSPNLSGQLGDATYKAKETGEGGRLNLNFLTAGENQQRLEVLRRYLENKGIDLNEREAMVDALLDWVEPNAGLHHLNAPPETDDYHPAHSPLTRVEELKQVAGWAEFTSAPGWDDDFTVSSIPGSIDLQWASRDVLLALPGLTNDIVDRFLQLRDGQDQIAGTADDVIFKSNDEIRAVMGLNPQQFQLLLAFITPQPNSGTFRVASVGKAGNTTRTVQIIFLKRASNGVVGNAPTVLSWKEF
jgi:general secretion pathway protein K